MTSLSMRSWISCFGQVHSSVLCPVLWWNRQYKFVFQFFGRGSRYGVGSRDLRWPPLHICLKTLDNGAPNGLKCLLNFGPCLDGFGYAFWYWCWGGRWCWYWYWIGWTALILAWMFGVLLEFLKVFLGAAKILPFLLSSCPLSMASSILIPLLRWWVLQTSNYSKPAEVPSWPCWLGPFPSAYSSSSKVWPSTLQGI